MQEKNYLTREENKLWSYIHDKELIDTELIKQIFPDMPKNKKNKLMHNLYKKSYLKRARKELYYNPMKIRDYYKLALKISEGYIGLSSALRYYNLIEYEDFTIFIMTKNFQKKIPIKGTKYDISFIPLKNLFTGFEKKDDLYISSIEKTFFDCFLKPRHIGFTNLTKALYNANLDWEKFLAFFKLADIAEDTNIYTNCLCPPDIATDQKCIKSYVSRYNSSLFQRTGYILELMKKETNYKIPSYVFEFLFAKVKNPIKLIPKGGKSSYNSKWKIEDNLGKENILSWWR